MLDRSPEAQTHYPACDRAHLMNAEARLQDSHASLDRLATRVVQGSDLWHSLQADGEARQKAAIEARRIVRDCVGCDHGGKRLSGVVQCPEETNSRVQEWLRNTICRVQLPGEQ